MRRLWFKIGLFVCVWYEVGRQLGLDGDSAFIVTAFVMIGGWLAVRMTGQLIGLLGPLTTALLVRLPVWLILIWVLAPPGLSTQPVVFKIIIFVVIGLLGARARHLFEQHRQEFTRERLREHSAAVVLVLFAALVCVGVSMHFTASLWPFIGYALLPGIPLSFGWRAANPNRQSRSDAKMGSADGFRDAGLSEEA